MCFFGQDTSPNFPQVCVKLMYDECVWFIMLCSKVVRNGAYGMASTSRLVCPRTAVTRVVGYHHRWVTKVHICKELLGIYARSNLKVLKVGQRPIFNLIQISKTVECTLGHVIQTERAHNNALTGASIRRSSCADLSHQHAERRNTFSAHRLILTKTDNLI